VLLRHTGTYTFAHEAQETLIDAFTPAVLKKQADIAAAAAIATATPAIAETKVIASSKKKK
jgi:hypothetical protein